MPHYEGDLRAPEGARFAILASRWNPRITDALVAGARKGFADHGVADDAVDVVRVPGAWELPQVAARRGALVEWRRNGAGSQILADLGLGKLRVLGTPRRQVGLAGYGLEVVEHLPL